MFVNETAFEVHWAIAYSIGLIIVVIAAYLGYIFAKKSDNKELLNKILFLVVVSLITMLITMLTKEIMARPRFRFVQEMNNYEYYKNWWQSGHEIKQSLNSNALSDEFSSFPSGHSSFSMFAIFIFPLLADYNKKIEKYRVSLFVLGVIWWALTAFSRLTVGAHYLSDVCFSGIFTIITYFIVVFVNTIINRRKKNIHVSE
jgi:membrane-associated phospholipid phosphatase